MKDAAAMVARRIFLLARNICEMRNSEWLFFARKCSGYIVNACAYKLGYNVELPLLCDLSSPHGRRVSHVRMQKYDRIGGIEQLTKQNTFYLYIALADTSRQPKEITFSFYFSTRNRVVD
jgi:hypothetical protein